MPTERHFVAEASAFPTVAKALRALQDKCEWNAHHFGGAARQMQAARAQEGKANG